MALWKDQTSSRKDPAPAPTTAPRKEPEMQTGMPPRDEFAQRSSERGGKESVIATDLAIEGTIQGSGSVRIAGRFTGDVHVKGDVTIETGAKVTGGIRANAVMIAGELEGNIESAARVELLASGVLTGDVKAGQLTVAAGSRMRGQVEFGWDEKGSASARPAVAVENSSAA
ncbi:MAG: polymer-forming cytoskeletal protein [Gemmatimonadetes bacterium]|nr:polymer-forming cytoskeletal protein [Gemmatimonadota bacterium]MCB9505349.1 polymer-forming cytoskeletal protein [Gemmatimonadales bacterium]MCA9762396.1 polymer-forming cytoskeletal protein [Gemmatimonadota bacterium]MCA9767883.1 polymer-forming cytoskeletal protein [Gemmatimonadota bacterium]HPF61554.1 polymer-forming cytoskeletal protein [Gemmatimonadales bacterium]